MTGRELARRRARPGSTTRPGRAAATSTTGGSCDGLRALGWAVREHAVAGAWPQPDAAALARAGRAVARRARRRRGAGRRPGRVRGRRRCSCRRRRRLRLVVLVHMPLGPATAAASERVLAAGRGRGHDQRRGPARWLLERYGSSPARVHVAEPGVDRGAGRRRARATAAGCSCVAAVTPAKGHDVLVAALAALRRPALALRLVGSLDRRPGLRRPAPAPGSRRAGSPTGCAFAGAAARRPTSTAAYAAADLLVLPSRAETLRDGRHRGAGPRAAGGRDRRRRGAGGARATRRTGAARAAGAARATRRPWPRALRALARPTPALRADRLRGGRAAAAAATLPALAGDRRARRRARRRWTGRCAGVSRHGRRLTAGGLAARWAARRWSWSLLVWRLGTGPFLDGLRALDAAVARSRRSRSPCATTVCCGLALARWSPAASGVRLAAARGGRARTTARSSSTRRCPAACSATCTGRCGTAATPATSAAGCGRWSGSGSPARSSRSALARRRPVVLPSPVRLVAAGRVAARGWSSRAAAPSWSCSAGAARRAGRCARAAVRTCAPACSRGALAGRRAGLGARRGRARRRSSSSPPGPPGSTASPGRLLPLALLVLLAMRHARSTSPAGAARGRRGLGVRRRRARCRGRASPPPSRTA